MSNYSIFLPSYSVGEECYKEIPYVTRKYGKKAVAIGGKTAMSKAKPELLKALELAGTAASNAGLKDEVLLPAHIIVFLVTLLTAVIGSVVFRGFLSCIPSASLYHLHNGLPY